MSNNHPVPHTQTNEFVKIQLRLPKFLIEFLEASAIQCGMTRDEFIHEVLAREYMKYQTQFQMKAEEPRKPLLQRANELISGDRQKDYGNKLQNFSQIAMLWQGTLATKLQPGAFITPEDVALCMIQVKIARLAKNPKHEDSILDVAGYAGCYEAIQNERQSNYGTLGATQDYAENG